MGNISTGLLTRLVHSSDKAAMRQLARLIIEGFADSPKNMRFEPADLLLFAADAGDRKAGWLLCKYHLKGAPGMEPDYEVACRWRASTEKQLFSDTQLLYCDPDLEHEAKMLYSAWRKWLDRHWPAECRPSAQNQSIRMPQERS